MVFSTTVILQSKPRRKTLHLDLRGEVIIYASEVEPWMERNRRKTKIIKNKEKKVFRFNVASMVRPAISLMLGPRAC